MSEHVEDLVEFLFTVSGMTCVACSNTVERLMKQSFSEKGMVEVNIVLLTCKMTARFKASAFTKKQVTPDIICEEVEMVGFECSLISMQELSAESLNPKGRRALERQDSEMSMRSINSDRLGGRDDTEENEASP
jgi:cation transport ATPase